MVFILELAWRRPVESQQSACTRLSVCNPNATGCIHHDLLSPSSPPARVSAYVILTLLEAYLLYFDVVDMTVQYIWRRVPVVLDRIIGHKYNIKYILNINWI